MRNFYSLVQNENMKIYRRPRTWLMLALLLALMVLVTVLPFIDKPSEQRSWEQRLQAVNKEYEQLLKREKLSEGDRREFQSKLDVNLYALEHKIPINERNVWTPVDNGADLILLVTIFTIIVSADAVAGEFSGGTIKLILIRPARRWKILLSKYIASLGYALFLLLALFAFCFLLGGAFYGLDALEHPYLYMKDGTIMEGSMMSNQLSTYALNCVSLIIMVTFGFMISTLLRSSTFAIGSSIVLLLMGIGIIEGLSKYNWAKYILFGHMDLTQHLKGRPIFADTTLSFSITLLAVYYVLFLLLAFSVFSRRDVAG